MLSDFVEKYFSLVLIFCIIIFSEVEVPGGMKMRLTQHYFGILLQFTIFHYILKPRPIWDHSLCAARATCLNGQEVMKEVQCASLFLDK